MHQNHNEHLAQQYINVDQNNVANSDQKSTPIMLMIVRWGMPKKDQS